MGAVPPGGAGVVEQQIGEVVETPAEQDPVAAKIERDPADAMKVVGVRPGQGQELPQPGRHPVGIGHRDGRLDVDQRGLPLGADQQVLVGPTRNPASAPPYPALGPAPDARPELGVGLLRGKCAGVEPGRPTPAPSTRSGSHVSRSRSRRRPARGPSAGRPVRTGRRPPRPPRRQADPPGPRSRRHDTHCALVLVDAARRTALVPALAHPHHVRPLYPRQQRQLVDPQCPCTDCSPKPLAATSRAAPRDYPVDAIRAHSHLKLTEPDGRQPGHDRPQHALINHSKPWSRGEV